MIETELPIINKLGLHARASAKLVETAKAHGATVQVGKPPRMVDAKSIMSVMMLGAKQGTILTLTAEGNDAEAAVEAITALAADYFGEGG